MIAALGCSSLSAMIDENGNGVSDVWEQLHGPLIDPDGDDDDDGFSNFQEAQAGTDPTDPQDHPRVSELRSEDPSELRNRFPTTAGVHYQFYVSSDLASWYPIGPRLRGFGRMEDVAFPLDATASTGTALVSKWSNVSSGNLNTIKGYAGSGSPAPTLTRELTQLEISSSSPDENNMGHWIRGWIVPDESGPHTFWLASDDSSELWISSDASSANLALRASVSQWTSFREWTRYPSQQSGPIDLVAGQPYAFEVFHREYNGGDHLSVAWTRPSRAPGTRDIIGGSALSTVGLSLNDLLGDAGRLFFRLEAGHIDSDGDGVNDYEESLIGLNPDKSASTPRTNDRDEALLILAAPHSVSLGVGAARAYESTGEAAEFVIFRSGGIAPVTVHYSVSGTASSGIDYTALTGSVQLPGGARAAFVRVFPLPDGMTEPPESVTLTLLEDPAYILNAPTSASVTIDDAPDIVTTAILRPPPGQTSGASGHAVLRRAGNSLSATFSLSFSGLDSPQLSAELLVSDDGLSGTPALALPLGQLSGLPWAFDDLPPLTRSDILDALDQGRLWVRVNSSLIGRLGNASTPPIASAPLPAPSTPALNAEAARFLAQATFGPSPADVAAYGNTPYANWIDAQIALPATLHLPYVQARRAEYLARDGSDGWQGPRQEAFWQHALTAPDQLRQRMAFALSQIFVISQFGALDGSHEAVTLYYDMLLENAFGNYRDLLEDVTLSPVMGVYLSMIRNRKPDELTGHEPDENYAREIMQLFSIGLVRLHPDGSVMLDPEGRPLPTYSQADTVALAHIFTGWGPHYDDTNPPRWDNGTIADRSGWFQWGRDEMRPMSFYPEYHDTEDRTLVGGVLIPGTLDGRQRMTLALDTLFHHPNVGPFLARQLIQRFVTSNPSPGYIARVAAVFADNGSGVRGDLGATLRAILLDPEARHPAYREGIARGKPAEPVLRMTRLLRGLTPAPPRAGDSRYFLNYQYGMTEQAPLLSPSVFNFFQPVYSNPGPIARAGLLSPEFQIFSETTAIGQANLLHNAIHWGIWTPEEDANGNDLVIRFDYTPWVALLNSPGLTPLQAQNLLLDRLDELFLFGTMTPALRQDILNAYAALPSWFGTTNERQTSRVRMALYLILNSPEAFVLR